MKKLSLAQDGDGFERVWAARILEHLPEFEAFWQRHIVPLTFRIAEEPLRSRFVRPSIKQKYVDLVDAHYAVFYHLAQAWSALDRIDHDLGSLDEESSDATAPTENLYVFLAHAISAYDSLVQFAAAVNGLFDSPSQQPFVVGKAMVKDKKGNETEILTGLVKIRRGDDFRKLNDVVKQMKTYRNSMMHRRVVFLQNGYLPKALRQEDLRYAGLVGISRMARDADRMRTQREFETHFELAIPWLEKNLEALVGAMRPVWLHAQARLDDLMRNDPSFSTRRERIDPRDREITEAKILQARKLGRGRP